MPVIANGWGVAMVGVLAGVLLLDVDIPWGAWPSLVLVVLVSSVSCTGLGLAMGALALRVRETAVLGNVIFCVLLVFCGTNIALDDLPAWMAAVGTWLPLTHAIEAGRLLADGAGLGSVTGLVLRELGVGALFTVLGLVMLRFFEDESRRTASLDRT